MRKILLATSALVAFAGAAQAAESPIQVTAGGYVDFRAALFHESEATNTGRRAGDFATEYGINFAAEGKAAGGIEYGAMITLNNRENTANDQIRMDGAYIWMSGAFGKVLMGDEHGASDLFVIAPTVGEGQIDGEYLFTDSNTLWELKPTVLDAKENHTKFTYYTPKVGNADHKVQLGVSYTPAYDEVGNDTALYHANIANYRDVIEVGAQYTGKFAPVNVVVSPMMVFADGVDDGANTYRDATVWGVGAQAMYAGFTLGGSYVDAGHFGTFKDLGENNDQNVWTVGLKYEFDKVAMAANYMQGQGYNQFVSGTNAYVDQYSAVGVGATYTWFPGLTSAADAVFFDQDRAGTAASNVGHVLMLSQKMAF